MVSFAKAFVPKATPKMTDVTRGVHRWATTVSVNVQSANMEVATRTVESISGSSALWMAYG